jgi:hypothetical protein
MELSRRVHASPDGHRRSLGVPTPPTSRPRVSLSALIPSWLPMRAPSVHLVMEEDGRIVGSSRAVEEPRRDDWVVTELDAEDGPMAAETRFELLHALIAAGENRRIARYHVACSDVRDNLELFGQVGFMAYAQETIHYRDAEPTRGPRSWLRRRVPDRRRPDRRLALQPAGPPDAWHLFDLWTHSTPPAIARIEAYNAGDWESVDHEAIVPRSSLTPLLHFGEVNAWLLPHDQRAAAFVQHGASREGPHYLRFLLREGVEAADSVELLRAALDAMGSEARAAGILSPVRTYEATGMLAATDAGFEPIGRVTLLVREVRAAVRQPAMVPAVR